MTDLSLPLKIIISFLIGAAIGLERESISNKKRKQFPDEGIHSVGVRTFSLITSLGTIAGLLLGIYDIVFATVALFFTLLSISYYIVNVWINKDVGITTEIGMLFSFVIGVLIGVGVFPIQVTIAISVIMILILSRKEDIEKIIHSIQRDEVHAFISFAIIALVILPFLPNQAYTVADIPQLQGLLKNIGGVSQKILQTEIVNPFKLWFIVAFVTGIDICGYILEKFIGNKKGRIMTSIVGGFVSSTATTQSLAQESKHKKRVNYLVGAALLANVVSFIQVGVLIAPINSAYFLHVLPTLGILIITGSILGILYIRLIEKKEKSVKEVDKNKDKNVFEIAPAIKFACIYVTVSSLAKLSIVVFGNQGFLVTSAFAALTGIDAVMITTAELVGKSIDIKTGILSLIIVNAVNLGGKAFYSVTQGNKIFALKLVQSFCIMIGATLIGLLFISS